MAEMEVVATISVDPSPSSCFSYESKIYIGHVSDAADGVSVIDVNTDTVAGTIAVSGRPRNTAAVGSTLYFPTYTNQTVSLVDATTDTLTGTTISVGSYPFTIFANGSTVYVGDIFDDNVKVIDSTTNTVTATIAVADAARNMGLVGTNLYCATQVDVSVLDTTTNTVSTTITSGISFANYVQVVGTKVYVSTATNTTIIDSATNSVIDTLPTLTGPMALNGTNLYLHAGNVIYEIDTVSNTTTRTLDIGQTTSGNIALSGTKLYTSNFASNNVKVIETGSAPSTGFFFAFT